MADAESGGAAAATAPHMRFERARIIGARALQISMGAPVILVTRESDLLDPVSLAEREYEAGVIPVTVRRPGAGEAVQRKHPGIVTGPGRGRRGDGLGR